MNIVVLWFLFAVSYYLVGLMTVAGLESRGKTGQLTVKAMSVCALAWPIIVIIVAHVLTVRKIARWFGATLKKEDK